MDKLREAANYSLKGKAHQDRVIALLEDAEKEQKLADQCTEEASRLLEEYKFSLS